MSQALLPLQFPLHGSRLIEASAGTGKTWTIAALYVRLVLGHGDEHAFARALLPSEILVMTFTRAATRELVQRIRERLVQAAHCFRGAAADADDVFLQQLRAAYPLGAAREQAAHRLMLAAETMDQAALFTIDAWCQRMLREHAFDSGSLFDEELLSDEQSLLDHAVRDYWRQQVYPLDQAALQLVRSTWNDVSALHQALRQLLPHVALLEAEHPASHSASLATVIAREQRAQQLALAELKHAWIARADSMAAWINARIESNPKFFHGGKLKADKAAAWFDAIRVWASDAQAFAPDLNATAWNRLSADGIRDAFSKGSVAEVPAEFDATPVLQQALAALTPLAQTLLRHAVTTVAQRIAVLKQRARQFGFADLLQRLKDALEGGNGAALRARIVAQFPVAMIDEFQDTSPDQYRIFDLLYRVADNNGTHGLFLIGDPKQSIYGFRGADMHSYLAAREATEGRHYLLGTNFRSSAALVDAVNQLFANAEQDPQRCPQGAFKFRRAQSNPLPFEPVAAHGRREQLVAAGAALPALTIWHGEAINKEQYYRAYAAHCAEHIVTLLNDATVGFESAAENKFTRLQAADIAILVRTGKEAAAVRFALQRRGVASVYLSDRDSVLATVEAADVLRWLKAVAHPLQTGLARAAFATVTAGLSLAQLANLAADDLAWERRVEQLKELHTIWRLQGVLAMLRRLIHQLALPPTLLQQPGGERSLTNLLHLAELLQSASAQLDGEQALIRWLEAQIQQQDGNDEERTLRLESDAQLLKVITIHKSKGLEFPLVYLPFAIATRAVNKRHRSFLAYTDAHGQRHIDLGLSDAALAHAEVARLEEDLRLLYVALTRARHGVWLGVALLPKHLEQSALAYLIDGERRFTPDSLQAALARLCDTSGETSVHTVVTPIDARTPLTALVRDQTLPALRPALAYSAQFERHWRIGSFSSLTRALSTMPMPNAALRQASDDKLLDDDVALPSAALASSLPSTQQVWHRFPRGPLPGNFLHQQLEWMAREGFAIVHEADFATRLAARCERAGWGHRQDETVVWLSAVATTVLPALGCCLADLHTIAPEMEFWFPSQSLRSTALDQLCRRQWLGNLPRPSLPERQLHGMLKGYADLIIEYQGRYWVLDYKSNLLGSDDSAYHSQALAEGMAAHRYDIQGAIYLLALHRLLHSRLGAAYDPAMHLGGALFFFLRGIGNQETAGVHVLSAQPALLTPLDALFQGGSETDAEAER